MPIIRRHHSWYFYLTVISFSLAVSGYLLWTFTPLKDEVEAVLIRRLQPYLGESFLINDFALGFDHVSFYKVRASDQRSTFSLDLEEIRVGVNPLKLFRRGFHPLGIIESVHIRSPHLTLYYSDELALQNGGGISLDRALSDIINNIKKFPEIDHVTIEDGAIFLQVTGRQRLPLLTRLGGRLNYLANSEEVNLDLRGEFLGAANSAIGLTGTVNFPEKRWIANLGLTECEITSDWPFWKLDFLEINSARLQGDIRVTNHGFLADSLLLDGNIRIIDYDSHIYGQQALADTIRVDLKRNRVIINPFDCRLETGRGRFGGEIPDIFSPDVDWRLTVADFPANRLHQSHEIFDLVADGLMAGEAHFSGPLNDLTVAAHVESPDILYAVVPFNTISADLTYNTRDKLLVFPSLEVRFMDFRTRGEGEINFLSERINLWLDSDIAVPANYFTILDGLNSGRITVHTNFTGNFKAKLFEGMFDYRAHGPDTVRVSGFGPFTLDDQLFRFNVTSRNLPVPFHFTGTVAQLFSGPQLETFAARHFPARHLTENPLVSGFLSGRAVHLYFAGPYDALSAKMKIVTREEQTPVLDADAHIRDIFRPQQTFLGGFVAYTEPRRLQGDFDVRFTESGVKMRLGAPDVLQGAISWGSLPETSLQGSVEVEHLSIAAYLGNSPSLASLFREGVLSGNMQFGGTVYEPEITFDLDARDFIVNQVGYYNTRLAGELVRSELRLRDCRVSLNGEPVFNARLNWNVVTDSLDLTVRAEDIESNFIAETIFRDPDLIEGRFNYALIARGPRHHPRIYGDIEIRDGFFKGNAFQSIYAAVEDSLLPGTSFWNLNNHIVKVRRFMYINSADSAREYVVDGEGIFSLDPHGPLDARVTVNGNVLAELPKVMPYFIQPVSNGVLYAHVRGTRASPYFQDVRLNIYDGTLRFDGIIPPLSSLRAEIELKDASTFVDIKTLEGKIDDRHVRIYNDRYVIVDTTALTPLTLDEIGLNFGILVFETDPGGIPLSIPGLMAEGDVGYFAARGKKSSEKFYFSGPLTLPLARGTLMLYNCRVTFPFIGMYDESGEYSYGDENRVIDFLMNMRWDVATIPGNNNRYFVNIPGYVGEVFMDLNIDNSSPGLSYSGRLIDESFRVEGGVESSRGRVEYLDVKFRVERFGAEFSEYEIFPEVYGKAYTTVRAESIDPDTRTTFSYPLDIYLVLYVIDPVTKKEVSKGRWEDFRFKLVSQEGANDKLLGETQEEVLAYLGYSVGNLRYKAEEVGLTMTENFLIRPLFRPIERQLEQRLKLDYVRLRSNFTTNLYYLSFQQNQSRFYSQEALLQPAVNNTLDPALILLQSSELTLGKYLVRDIYLTYTGQVVSSYEGARMGVNHTWGLEYRLLNNLLLEIELNRFQFNPFYTDELPNDFRIRLRHSINF